jgi:hypothetical protein
VVKGENVQAKNSLRSLLTAEYQGLKICTSIAYHYIIQYTTFKTVQLTGKVKTSSDRYYIVLPEVSTETYVGFHVKWSYKKTESA